MFYPMSGMTYRLHNEENTDKERIGKLERMTDASFFNDLK